MKLKAVAFASVLIALMLTAFFTLQTPEPRPAPRAPAAAVAPEPVALPRTTPPSDILPEPEDLARIRWTPRPCVDFLEHLRASLDRNPPLLGEEEALALKNDGAEANRKILSALGRFPPNDDAVDWSSTFHRWLPAEPASLNPVFRSSLYEAYFVELLAVYPVDYDWEFRGGYGNLDIIESWDVSEDGLMDRIVLRKDLTWSDGKPVTA
ncbi:MAG TPA: hypothetical protein VMT52_02430, partial [Planctomycetota bacterium]|nr:hypothetical protein [Planctomycetota bacterium]